MNNKYELLEQIGSGSFGTVYKGRNKRTGEFVAIKMEPISNETKLLKNESAIYQYLQNSPGIPLVRWFGKDKVNYYMVMDLLGDSLETLKKVKTSFSLKLTLQIGIQVLDLLMFIHDKSLIHRDIKPDNFLLGVNEKNNQLYIVDFGFCKCYMKNNKHISLGKTSKLIGSLSYASLNAHNNFELSRRDDIESLCYMLIYLHLGKLSWQEYEDTNIQMMKIDIINDISVPKILIHFLSIVRNTGFEDRPQYLELINLLNTELVLL